MDNRNLHEKEIVWLQILYLYVAPTLLLYYGVVPGGYRILMLFGVALLLYGIVKRAHWTYADLEIRKDFMKDIVPYATFTILGIGFLFWLSQITSFNLKASSYEWWEDIRFLLLFIPISVLQEIVFRGILMKLLRRAFKSMTFIIVLNASLFALIHVIYDNSIFILPMTFIGGIGFAWIYYKYPNLILVSIAHTVLNFVAMTLGFFVIR